VTGPINFAAYTPLTAAPVRPAPAIPWRAFVCETVTGEIKGEIPFIGKPQWDYGINSQGSLTLTVPIGRGGGALTKEDIRALLDPWRFSWGIAWGGYIVQCGPMVGYQYSDSASGAPSVRISCVGIWGLFTTKRILANPGWNATTGKITDPEADINLSGLSLHTIAKRLIQFDMQRNGSLPIDLPADIPGSSTRNYPGYDLAYVGERLAQLTQVIDGPEVEFRPRFTDMTHTKVEWEMRVGNPRLGNLGRPHAWDYGNALREVNEDGNASKVAFRWWARGNGMERGLLVGKAQDLTPVSAANFPVLESVDGQHTSVTEEATLQSWAEADVATYQKTVVTRSATVSVDGTDGQGRITGSPRFDLVQVGDTATFNIRDHTFIPDGVYGQRIIRVSSGSESVVNLGLQGVSA